MDIEEFHGDPLKYPAFINAFDEIIDKNPRLPDVQKFYYLRSLLKGKAKTTISGFVLTDSNYREALNLLKKRYGDNKLLQSRFISSLMDLKPVSDSRDTKALRHLHDNIETNIRNLKSLNINPEMYGTMLVPCIMKKLPDDIQLEVTKSTGDSWDFDRILDMFNDQLMAREKCEFVTHSNDEFKVRKERKSNDSNESSSTGSLLLTTMQQGKKTIACLFCSQNHKAWHCNVVTDPKTRKEIILDQKRCIRCLTKSHTIETCKSKFKCFKCKGKHNSCLCDGNPEPEQGMKMTVNDVTPDEIIVDVSMKATVGMSPNGELVLLKTIIATFTKCPDPESETNVSSVQITGRILFDDASTRTYITTRHAANLQLVSISKRNIIIKGACATSTTSQCDVVQVCVKTANPQVDIIVTAHVIDMICHPIEGQRVKTDLACTFPYLKGVEIKDLSTTSDPKNIDVLIGSDYYYSFITNIVKQPSVGRGPVATWTKIGWVLSGPITNSNGTSISPVNVSSEHAMLICYDDTTKRDALLESAENLWKLDCIGIDEHEDSVYDTFCKQLEFVDGRYITGLSWKRDPASAGLPDNKSNSLKQMMSKLRALKGKNPKLLAEYHDILQKQKENGIFELCPETDIPSEPIHYLPHRPVVKEDKTSSKVRIVYNGSSKLSKELPSLNDCLLKGPSMNPLILELLLRFRLNPTAFVCDIKKAFLQIGIKSSERDLLRFFWVDDPFKETPKVLEYRFCRVLFGLTCSPFILNATLREHLKKYLNVAEPLVISLINSLFVDDIIGGDTNVEMAKIKFDKLVQILKEAHFELHKFVSNDANFTQDVFKRDANFVKTEFELGQSLHEVLGVIWNFKIDNFLVNFGVIVEKVKNPSKRTVLRIIAKIYDPLGLCSPVVLVGKLIFQEFCRRDIGWDEIAPDDLQQKWNVWIDDLITGKTFSLPRCYEKRKIMKSTLIGFSDGSSYAYAAAVYLRNELENDAISTILVCSKARVAPLEKVEPKKFTVPRLELLGCFVLAHLMETVEKSLSADNFVISEKRYYTDATICLGRLQGVNKEHKQWVGSRVRKILSKSHPEEWFYVPSKENAADLPSRGCTLLDLQENTMWTIGPQFLREKVIPIFPYQYSPMNESCLLGFVSSPILNRCGYLQEEYFKTIDNMPKLHKLFDVKNYNDFDKLLRVTAYVLRFATKVNSPATSEELSTEEIEVAKRLWLISEQTKQAKEDKNVFVQTANNLRFIIGEDGLIRCQGRLKHSDLPFNSKFPVYVPKSSEIARLLVNDAHDAVFHQKVSPTLVQFRTEYWIPSGRQFVRKVVLKCNLCRLYNASPYQPTISPDLPKFRVEVTPPFTNVGTDHVGPLLVRDIYAKSKTMHKCYISLFSCCVTRMLHLELQPNVEAESTVRSMRRTFARVGTPALLISDNHKTYRAEKTRNFALKQGIKWRNILNLSPNWGGFYERMNSTIKDALRKTLKHAHLNYEELETIIIEIESVMNSRPLTYVDDDELLEPLTPSHLMFGRRLRNPKDGTSPEKVFDDTISPTKRREYVNKLLNNFWNRFSNEYLTSLRERTDDGNANPNIDVGQVVIVKEKKMPRNTWKLGRVQRVVYSKDGVAKGAELLTKDGLLKRPLSLLCPVELQND